MAPAGSGTTTKPQDDDEILGRMVELERLLAEDKARKPRFQKPDRQARWQAELEDLTRKIE